MRDTSILSGNAAHFQVEHRLPEACMLAWCRYYDWQPPTPKLWSIRM